MNPIVLDMMCAYSGDPYELYSISDDDKLSHNDSYEAQGSSAHGAGGRTKEASSNGIGSGRWPVGSGNRPYQHGIGDFLDRVDYLKKSGVTKSADLAVHFGCKTPKEFRELYQSKLNEYHAGLDPKNFIDNVDKLRKSGVKDSELASIYKCGESSGDFRTLYSMKLHEFKRERAEKAQKMLDSGMSKKAVARAFGTTDTSVTSWLNESSREKTDKALKLADFIEGQLKEKKMVEVGSDVCREFNCPPTRWAEAIKILEGRGYQKFGGRVPQATNKNGKQTTLTVLATSDQEYGEIYKHPEKIGFLKDYIIREGPDGKDEIQKKWQYPASLDSSRLLVRYKEDLDKLGHKGAERDGTIEIRRNVPDLDLKGSHYAQVRILVDDKKYLKGMAHYSDDIPEGYDVVFNTSKGRDKADIALKDIKKDPNNPFGVLLRDKGGQYTYKDPKTGEEKLGLINKTRQEGDWEEWTDSLPSQFLAKQPMELINKQLGLAIKIKKAEYEDILKVTNPTVRKELLIDFANGCDADAVDLHAASLPRQKYQVILPVPTLGDDEVYAPNFLPGETIALVRFPNQGIFEIPILKVNNNNPQGRALMGTRPMDAIGLNSKNASILSGADYDGDTVMCIPCNDPKFSTTKIMNRPPLAGLEGFEPKDQYGYDREEQRQEKVRVKDRYGNDMFNEDGTPKYEMKTVSHYYRNGKEFKQMKRTGLEMGKVSNLMMDMTLQAAEDDELAMVARHAQVVIDAEKHHLDWKASEKDNHIIELKKKYQKRVEEEDGSIHYGAASLITRAKSPTRVPKPTGTPHIDPETGKLVYREDQLKPQVYTDYKTGKEKVRQSEKHLLDTVFDKGGNAVDLVYNKYDDKEMAYANYSNQLKAMANEARKVYMSTEDIPFNKQAEAKYSEETTRLLSELAIAESNAPREKQAQLYARGIELSVGRDNPEMTKKQLAKVAAAALAEGRVRFGASRHEIDISPREWEAIQSGAIHKTKLKNILKYADMDKVRQYAMPKERVVLSEGQKARILRALEDEKNNVTAATLAARFGVSVSTINALRKKE